MDENSAIHLDEEGSGDFVEIIDKEGMLNNWMLVSSPLPVLTLLTLYLVFVLKLGPALMASREPYDVRLLMRLYNLAQVVYNCWVLRLAFSEPDTVSYLMDHSCHPLDSSTVVNLRDLFLRITWHFVFLKQLDLADTIFMVLRKKDSHITFLHLYHHIAMSFTTWFCARFLLSQQAAIPGLINMFVHSVMYAYYFLATFGPGVQRFLWWKQLLTGLQMGQFVLVIIYLLILYHNDCEVSRVFALAWLANVVVILVFFINFYIRTYIMHSRTPDKTVQKKQS